MPITPFTKLLWMLLTVSDVDGKTAADHAGISQSRFYGISGGTVRPSEAETRDLFDACLTAGTRTKELLRQARVDPTGLAWTLWKSGQHEDRPEVVEARLLVDRLSLTANTRSERILREFAKRYGKRGSWPERLYEDRFEFPGFILQFGPKDKEDAQASERRYARLELWRSELGRPNLSRQLFDVLDLDTAALTRVDVAVDLDVDMRLVHVIPSHKRKVHASWYWGGCGLETLYVFAPPRRVRIYDKGRESGSKAKRTRFEAEVRSPSLGPRELAQLPNPFDRFALVQFVDDGSFEHQLLAREARLFGLPAVLAELSEEQQAAFTAAMKPARWLPHPREVFDADWKRVASALMRRLGW